MSLPEPPYNATFYNQLRRVGDVWLKWFELLKRSMNLAPQTVSSVSLSGRTASIAATAMAPASLPSGLYLVSLTQRVTTADNVGSSLTAFLTVTESGLTVTYTGAANTSNATGTGKSDVFAVLIDGSTPIKYGTTYSSTGGAPAMTYRLTVRVQAIAAVV